MKYKYIYLICMLIFISACRNESAITGNGIPGIVEECDSTVQRLEIGEIEEGSVSLFSNLFSDVKYVPLESTANSMVGEITKLLTTKEGDYLVFDMSSKTVLLFDSAGHFMHKIGCCGHAENEYIGPLEIDYDSESDQIFIYDNAKKVIKIYGVDGRFHRDIPLETYIGSFVVVDSSRILLFMNYRNFQDQSKDGIAYNFEVIDWNGKVQASFAPYDDRMSGKRFATDVFQKCGSRIFFHASGTPYVCEFVEDHLVPLYYIDFGKHQIPREWFAGDESDFQKTAKLPYDLSGSISFFQTGNHLVMSFRSLGNAVHLYFASKDDIPNYKYAECLDNNMYGKSGSINLLSAHNGKCYFLLNPNDINEFENLPPNTDLSDSLHLYCKKLTELKDLEERFRKRFTNLGKMYSDPSVQFIFTPEEKAEMLRLSKNNNPIIQVCTLK